MAVTIKTKEEIVKLREGGRRLARILSELVSVAKPGVSTGELDLLAEKRMIEAGGRPSFKGYRISGVGPPYPGSICASINDEVVHGIPRQERKLHEGDIIGLDIGMWYEELCTDMAVTIGIGIISSEAQELLKATKESLDAGIAAVKPGATVGDIGAAVHDYLKQFNYGIIRDLAGHGVGYELHEEPLIPNYGKPGKGIILKEGMVIAIEPMATLGDWRITLDRDEWTFRTIDKSLAAHFEHTMAVTKDGAEVLTK